MEKSTKDMNRQFADKELQISNKCEKWPQPPHNEKKCKPKEWGVYFSCGWLPILGIYSENNLPQLQIVFAKFLHTEEY